MNPLDPDRERDRLIDRLVDGELNVAERRALLLLLDSEVGGQGWRRCALAFLEAQAWREAVRPASSAAAPLVAPVAQADVARLPIVETNRASRFSRFRRNVGRLAIAASLVGAFVLGWSVRQPVAPTVPLVNAVTPVTPVDPKPNPKPNPSPVGAEQPDSSDGMLADATEAGLDVDDSNWNAATLDVWQRQGFAVDQRERMASVGLDDGRQLTMPVSEVRLKYVGNRMY